MEQEQQESNLRKEAFQAFQEKFGATPKEKGFPEVKEKNPKVVFAKSYQSLADYEIGEKVKTQYTLFAAVIVAIAFILCVVTSHLRGMMALVIFLALIILITGSEKMKKRLKKIKAEWKGKLLIYDARTDEFYD